jgi:hypothetical protein
MMAIYDYQMDIVNASRGFEESSGLADGQHKAESKS